MISRLSFELYGLACKLLAAMVQLKKRGRPVGAQLRTKLRTHKRVFLRPRSLGRRDWLRDGTGVYRETKVRREAPSPSSPPPPPPSPPPILPAFVTQSFGPFIHLCSLLRSRSWLVRDGEISR